MASSQSEKLLLRYKLNTGKFAKKNLEISFTLKDKNIRWQPADTMWATCGVPRAPSMQCTAERIWKRDDYRGTAGRSLIDDSIRPLFHGSEWPRVQSRPGGARQDWYFFGNGHDYKQALYDFTRVAGKIPMPPRFAFRIWLKRKGLKKTLHLHPASGVQPHEERCADHRAGRLQWQARSLRR